jgi:endo-1,4-beta-D-glucanase Y
MAGTAFRNAAYVARARELLLAIRTHESLRMPRGSFPAAGNWAVADRLVNLSYFLPYAYPYFARVDPAGGWDAAVDAGYGLIAGVHSLPGVRLAPDFITVDADGHPTLSPSGNAPTVGFTSDSVRTYWRTALDCQMHARPRACADPLHAMQLQELIARDGALFTLYDLDGTPRERTTSLSFYGAAFPYLLLHAPALGRALREGPLSAPSLTWMATDARRYYDANWVWFGLAAGEGLIARWTPSIDSVGH